MYVDYYPFDTSAKLGLKWKHLGKCENEKLIDGETIRLIFDRGRLEWLSPNKNTAFGRCVTSAIKRSKPSKRASGMIQISLVLIREVDAIPTVGLAPSSARLEHDRFNGKTVVFATPDKFDYHGKTWSKANKFSLSHCPSRSVRSKRIALDIRFRGHKPTLRKSYGSDKDTDNCVKKHFSRKSARFSQRSGRLLVLMPIDQSATARNKRDRWRKAERDLATYASIATAVSKVAVSANYPQTLVQHRLEGQHTKIRHCYVNAGGKTPVTPVAATLQFSIDKTGKPVSLNIKGPNPLRQCIEKILSLARFAPPGNVRKADGKPVTASAALAIVRRRN